MMQHTGHILMTADTVGGVWTYAVDLCAALADHGLKVTLVSMGAMPNPERCADIARLPNVSLVPTDFRLEWMPGAKHELEASGDYLLRLERNLKPDIVHINGYWHAGLPLRAPVLAVAHSCVTTWWHACLGAVPPEEWHEYETWVRRAVKTAEMLVAPSASYLHDFQERHGTAKAARVIHNGRDPQRFTPGRKQNFVLAAGRLWDRAKNIATLCNAARGLTFPVAVAGATTDPDGKTSVLPNVETLGNLRQSELAQIMAQAAIFAAPARYEPFGLTIVEAGLSGCALVLGDIATYRELWEGAAEFVSPDDEDALRDALRRLGTDPADAARRGQKARRRARHYSHRAMGDAYAAAYRALPAERIRPAAFEAVA